jgi:sRNA-binding regulator protein Hfq
MKIISILPLCFVLLAGLYFNAAADTIYLNNGVRFDGVVTQLPDGNYRVNVGERVLIYRAEEIDRIEQNDRTGHFNWSDARERWAKQDAELQELTGLNAEQRKRVRELLYDLQITEDSRRMVARDELLAMQTQIDIFPYLQFRLDEVSHRLSPWVLEAMYYISPQRALPHLRRNTEHVFYGTRQKAIELLGRMEHTESAPLIARGLVDHNFDVRAEAALSLARLSARYATPALIETMIHPDMRVSQAAHQALQTLWHASLGESTPQTVNEWNDVWEQHSSTYDNPLELSTLTSFILPEHEFMDE